MCRFMIKISVFIHDGLPLDMRWSPDEHFVLIYTGQRRSFGIIRLETLGDNLRGAEEINTLYSIAKIKLVNSTKTSIYFC